MDDVILGSHGQKTRSFGSSGSKQPFSQWSATFRRYVSAVLAVLMVASVLTLVSGQPVAADTPLMERLPVEFIGEKLNNHGEVAGTVNSDGVQSAAIYKDGKVDILPGGAATKVLDFNDKGEVLVRGLSGIEVRTRDNVRVLENIDVNGSVRTTFNGFGPDENGNVVGVIGWQGAQKTNAVSYIGAAPPQLITSISTALIANYKGVLVGQNTGTPGTYSMVKNGVVTPMPGVQGNYLWVADFSDAGHFVYMDASGTRYQWFDGKVTNLGTDFIAAVNSEGVMLGSAYDGSMNVPFLRFPNGRKQNVVDLIGGYSPGWSTLHVINDINDSCQVLARGTYKEGANPTTYPSTIVHVPKCEAEDFEGNFFRTDSGLPNVGLDETVDVRLRVANVSMADMTNVKVTNVEAVGIEWAGDVPGEATLTQKGDDLPTALASSGLASQGFVDFELTGVEGGKVKLVADVSGTRDGEVATGKIETVFSVRAEDLVVNLTLDPPEYEVPEDGEFEPVDITATVSFTNATEEEMTELRLQDLDVSRVFAGQELYVTYKSGIRPDPLDPEVIVPVLPPGATSPEFQAVFTATEDGEVEFSAMATAKRGENAAATGVKKLRWKAKVKKYVEITTEVTNPADGGLIEAGLPVAIDGTIENLTNNYEITMGPLFPTLEGNAGTMTLAYDGLAPNPSFPVPVDPLVLAPGEKRTFQVRFTTNYSDPRMYGAQPSGGTRAYATFEPWGQAVEIKDPNDGEPDIVDIRTYDEARPGNGSAPGEAPDAQVKASPEALFKRISIDDSIELPAHPFTAVVAGIGYGAVQGIANAAIATIYAIPDLLTMPYTVLVGAWDFQAKVWESFTEEEKELFLTELSYMTISILQRNVEFGMQNAEELYDQVYAAAGEHLVKTQNDWHTGDFMATATGYSAFMSEQIGSVAGPLALSKMAQSPKAIAALERYQVALNAKAASIFASARNIKYVDNVLPMLQAIENGVEPTLTAIAKLWGITPEEIAEYQRICGIIGCMATVRSRHASSIEWIRKWGAMLKPENLKIKTVNELDVMLGYNFDDLGSLIFRKPDILKNLGSNPTEEQIKSAAKQFAASKGFKAGSTEYAEAVKRLEDRVDEWFKHEKTYKQWNERGWIDTSFNYEGNAIPEYRYNAQGEVVGQLTGADKGKFTGFKMRETSPGSEEYVVMMLDGKTGKWRRITGDIDPVDFTYLDGSPLSPADHARLMNLLQNSPIGAEHGYTSTFLGFKDPKTGAIKVKPGPELVKKQFKPNEPALQIAPNANPRATRIDIENSRWNDAYDYNMRWVNGFVDAGTKRDRGLPMSVSSDFQVIPNNAPDQIALPVRVKPADPTVGRFIIKHGNSGDEAAMVMGANGQLQKVLPDGTTEDSPLHAEAFDEGQARTITVSPASTLVGDDAAPPTGDLVGPRSVQGPTKMVMGPLDPGVAAFNNGADVFPLNPLASVAAPIGATSIRVSLAAGLASGSTGFEVGQVVSIGTGTDHPELRTITAINGDRLTLDSPLGVAHAADEVVMMVVSSTGIPINPNRGLDPLPTTDSPSGGGTTPITPGSPQGDDSSTNGTAGGGDQTQAASDRKQPVSSLPRTGTTAAALLMLAFILLLAGYVILNGSRVRGATNTGSSTESRRHRRDTP